MHDPFMFHATDVLLCSISARHEKSPLSCQPSTWLAPCRFYRGNHIKINIMFYISYIKNIDNQNNLKRMRQSISEWQRHTRVLFLNQRMDAHKCSYFHVECRVVSTKIVFVWNFEYYKFSSIYMGTSQLGQRIRNIGRILMSSLQWLAFDI